MRERSRASLARALPSGQRAMEAQVAAMEMNGVFRHTNIRGAIGSRRPTNWK